MEIINHDTKFLLNQAAKEFKYGKHDCVHFVADYLKEKTGKDYLINFRNKYDSFYTSRKIIKDSGFNSLEELVTHELGVDPFNAENARDGDILLYYDEHNLSCVGLCLNESGIFITHRGLIRTTLNKCKLAWRV